MGQLLSSATKLFSVHPIQWLLCTSEAPRRVSPTGFDNALIRYPLDTAQWGISTDHSSKRLPTSGVKSHTIIHATRDLDPSSDLWGCFCFVDGFHLCRILDSVSKWYHMVFVFTLSDLPHLAWSSLGLSMLLQMSLPVILATWGSGAVFCRRLQYAFSSSGQQTKSTDYC